MQIEKNITRQLGETANSYLALGFERYKYIKTHSYENFQPVLGNISISVELMLKSLISKKAFSFLYTNLPQDLQIKLNCIEEYKLSRQEHDGLKNFSFKTQEIDKCISIFYTLFPEQKIKLKPYFTLFSNIRNISVHAVYPNFQKYDLERILYLALNLSEILKKEKIHPFDNHLNNNDNNFLKNYNVKRIERVKKEIEKAKINANKVENQKILILNFGNWETYEIKCPVCQSKGYLEGTTEYEADYDERHGETSQSLEFIADSYKCDECSLELLDSTELELAGIEYIYDRSMEISEWFGNYIE